jgi:multiple sugar transport system substrate-binding protein
MAGRLISRRSFLHAGASALAAGAVAGCARDEPLPPGHVRLNFYTYGTPPEFVYLFQQQLVPAFEKLHPTIHVRVNYSLGDAGYDAKLLTLIAGRMAPDLIHVTQQNFPFYAARNVLMPLDDLLARDSELSASDFFPQVIDGMRFGGQQLGLPSGFSAICMLYNQDLFERFRIPFPHADWNRDEFLDTCRGLTRDLDNDGHIDLFGTVNPSAYNRWPAWVWMNGGEIMTPDLSRCVMDSPEAIEGLEFYVDLSKRHNVAPTPGQAMGQDGQDLFASQLIGMIADSRYAYKRFIRRRALPFGWDVAPMPRHKTRATTFIWGGNCILRTTKYPAEAWEFLKFMSGPIGAEINIKAGNALPAYAQAAIDEVANPIDPQTPPNDHYFLDAVQYGRTAPNPPQYAEYVQAMTHLADAYIEGRAGISVEEASRRFAREVNGFLEAGVF